MHTIILPLFGNMNSVILVARKKNMFLKLLEKIGRKKTVLDRGPSHPEFKEAKPWLNRYYLLFR